MIAAFLWIVALQFSKAKNRSNNAKTWTPVDFDWCECRCRSDHDGHRVLAFHETAQRLNCALYDHHKRMCACPSRFNICMLCSSEALKHALKKNVLGQNQTMKHRLCDFLGLNQLAFSDDIRLCSDHCNKQLILSLAYVLTLTRIPFATLRHTCGLQHVHVANAFWPQFDSSSKSFITRSPWNAANALVLHWLALAAYLMLWCCTG